MKFKLFISGVLITAIFACQKQNTQVDYNDGVAGARNYVFAQQMMVQLLDTYFKSLTDSSLIVDDRSKIDGADVYYYPPPEERILIEYPTWGSDDGYGHWRINSYEAIPRTSFDDPEAVVDINFIDFLFDKDTLDVQNLVIQSLGKTDGQNDHFKISANNVSLTYRDTTGTMSFSFDQEYAKIKDQSTVYTSPNDEYKISGKLSGTSKDQLVFQGTIPADSVITNSFSCTWLKGGRVVIQVERFTFPTFVYFSDLDNCVNKYEIYVDDNPFPFPFDL
jgi:hypothetical protein